jgi:hypothetical protein
MSENYRFYATKMAQRRLRLMNSSPELQRRLEELLSVVEQCETMWALEDRIEKSR